MNNFIQRLRLDSLDVKNLAETYEGYAIALTRGENSDDSTKSSKAGGIVQSLDWQERSKSELPSAASSWLISALFQALYDSKKAIKSFANAGLVFRRLGWPVWMACGICSAGRYNELNSAGADTEYLRDEERFLNFLHDTYFGSVSLNYSFNSLVEKALPRLGHIPGTNISYGLFYNALAELSRGDHNTQGNAPIAFLELINRLNESNNYADVADHHWQNLMGTIVPFDPIPLAMSMVIVQKWQQSVWPLESQKLLDEEYRRGPVLLHVAESLIQANIE